ncbi:MAG: hypothetical protein HXX12_07580 [Geothrix sp.]|uniref:hypothetical protein n=1 Tax=Geothrix sp. TaxID=1962974 RepID=UPI0017C5B658|nr:hypothetical protein [Geothrix sp.]NWJ40817.1 hypothetical protein [Geothrix sp.]WIL21181.1 MAG: hypothetical protein QOZ81_000430 [Geothrix sp.]
MNRRFICMATAVAALGLTLGCLYPDHDRGRGPGRRDERRDDRRDDRRDKDHEDKREHMSGLSR